MPPPNQNGSHEIDTAKQRLAAAEKSDDNATQMMETAQRMIKTAQQMIDAARRQKEQSKKEREDATESLNAAEKRWDVIDLNSECGTPLDGRHKRKRTLSPADGSGADRACRGSAHAPVAPVWSNRVHPESNKGYSGAPVSADATGAIERDSDDDSLDDDDDSRFGPDDTVWDYMIVEGCGIAQVNGTYKRSGSADKVPKYLKNTLYDGKDEDFMIFRCLLCDLTRRWYISIVPRDIHPGTTRDIDFYAAPIPRKRPTLPPKKGWTAVKGVYNGDPYPQIYPSNTDVPYTA